MGNWECDIMWSFLLGVDMAGRQSQVGLIGQLLSPSSVLAVICVVIARIGSDVSSVLVPTTV